MSLRSFLLVALLMPVLVLAQRPTRLTPSGHVRVNVPECSDLALIPGPGTPRFFVVSDNGFAAEIRSDGSMVRRSAEIGFDLEGALLHEGQLMVVDERTRRVLWLDTADLRVTRRLTYPYAGGRNRGYEGIAWNPLKERFLLVTERDPVHIFELDAEMRVVNEVDFDRSIRDISSATWHDGHLWLLSDMDMLLLKCDPMDYRILERWEVPVLNPEGFAFDGRGTLYVLSDDMQRLYTFPFSHGRAE